MAGMRKMGYGRKQRESQQQKRARAPDTPSAPCCPAFPPSLSSSLELNRKVRKRFIIQSLLSLCYKPSRKAGVRHASSGKHICFFLSSVCVGVGACTHTHVCVFLWWGKAGGGLYLCAWVLHVYMNTQRAETDIGRLPQVLSMLFFWRRFSHWT